MSAGGPVEGHPCGPCVVCKFKPVLRIMGPFISFWAIEPAKTFPSSARNAAEYSCAAIQKPWKLFRPSNDT
eukprot:8712511-Pyramimonas_sp.AAC.1